MNTPLLRVISLGAGVQSTTMALMAAHGEIGPMPDCAIFADTGWEPEGVYAHLAWLERQLPFPVHHVSRANLRDDLLRNARGESVGKRSTIPAFTLGNDGRAAPLTRQCTLDYKVEPIRRKLRELLGAQPGKRVPAGIIAEQWIGISTDEAARMKSSRDKYAVHRWPLIEHRMTRNDCLRWFERRYPARTLSKSACLGCPYHSDAMWREIRDTDPVGWADAVDLDHRIRAGFIGNRGEVFLHRSLKPLDQVDLRTFEDMGQLNMFINECEGMCGI